MSKILAIIDVQKYFINDLTKDLPGNIKKFLEQNDFDHLIFTQFLNNEKNNLVRLMNWHYMSKSPEIDIADELLPFTTKDNSYIKNGYSMFKEDKILRFLENNKIEDICLCGMNTEQCILINAIDAFDHGYRPIVITNLCRSSKSEVQHTLAIENLKDMIGEDQVI